MTYSATKIKQRKKTYSHPVTFDSQSLFERQGMVSDTVEMTLGGNLALADMQRLQCSTDDKATCFVEKSLRDTYMTVNPMQIRTIHIPLA